MQLLTSISKNLIAFVLTLSVIAVWYSSNTDLNVADKPIVISTPKTISLPPPPALPVRMAPVKTTNDIWSSITNGFKINHQEQSRQVQAEIRKLLADQGKLYSILKAAAPYLYFIHQQTEARGLPSELALIPVIESEFNPNDHSNKGATGLWQLMAGTAHELGVTVKTGYDGRRNVVASTKAALAYFNDLGNSFKNNWYLAIAAYNCGQGKVMSAQRKTGSQNFWNLPLPKETKLYVPKLLAVAAIVEAPEKYGVQLPHINNQPYFATLKVKKAVNLDKVAKNSGISVATLKTLNPDYKNGATPPVKKDGATFLVPINKAPVVAAQVQTV